MERRWQYNLRLFEERLRGMKILVVDDDEDSRTLLKLLLGHDGYQVILAENGRQGEALFRSEHPHLVLMDVMMPEQDGYETAAHIKQMQMDTLFVPIIFLTSLETEEELSRCLECGGDDFLNKPFSRMILRARVRAWLRKSIWAHQLAFEQETVENVLQRMRQTPSFSPRNIRFLNAPVEKTTGDVIFSAINDRGVQHVMVGDFTGHGLPAALSGPMVSDIFYSMNHKGFGLAEILSEMNRKIKLKIPTGMFLAAVGLELDLGHTTARIWNGGMPNVLVFRHNGLCCQFPSFSSFLGILPMPVHSGALERVELNPGDHVVAFTDGLVETRNPQGEMFGLERTVTTIEELLLQDKELEQVMAALTAWQGHEDFLDDITVVDFRCP